MSLLCDRPIVHVDIDVDPYNNNNNNNNGNNGVRQGKRKEVEKQVMMRSNPRSRFYIQHQDELDEQVEEEEIGSDRSSIGVDSNCTSSLTSSAGEQEQEEEEEVNSKLQSVKGGGLGLGSFDSLEESLPIKKGLSKFFSGKSKSFTTLSSVINSSASTSDLAKAENPFNKRRRILLTCNRRRSRASYSSFVTSLPPLLSPQHEQQLVDEDIDRDDDGDDGDDGLEKLEGKPKPNPKPPAAALLVSGMMMVTSSKTKHNNGFMISPTRSFSLSDLQPHHHHHHHHHHV